MLQRSHLARRYARRLGQDLKANPFRDALWGAAQYEEHGAISAHVALHLRRFLGELDDAADGAEVFDWEGNKARKSGSQAHSYDLLGTGCHPDAAILRPFTCAIEIDREAEAASAFKKALLKASAHVLSGAYDACLFVYLLQPGGTEGRYVKDGSDHTERLLSTLAAHGLVVSFVGSKPGKRAASA